VHDKGVEDPKGLAEAEHPEVERVRGRYEGEGADPGRNGEAYVEERREGKLDADVHGGVPDAAEVEGGVTGGFRGV